MLSIDTNYADDREMEKELQNNVKANLNDSLAAISSISNIQLKTPMHGIHPYQRKQKHPALARANTTPTASVTSRDSAHTRSGHSKNSRTTKSSNDNSNNGSGILVSSFSSLATQSIEGGKYKQALEYYKLALQDYTKDSLKTTVVELVNAAATCFNLGALAKKLRDYPQAAEYFLQAQDIYRQSGLLVESYAVSGGAVSTVSPSAASSGSSASASAHTCQVCILQLIVETLQARAHLHYKYQSLVDDAMECHEEVIELLDESDIDIGSRSKNESQVPFLEHDVVYHKIHFITLPQSLRWQLLVTSLQALGKFYVEKGELDDAIMAYQDTLSTLKKLDESQFESTSQRQQEILQILGALSEFSMQKNLESTDVVKLERLAFLQEDLGRWEKAMQCWERVLYCQSKEYGDDSFEVSIALGQLARVMVLEGNLEGALDLYKATTNISLRNAQGQSSNGYEQPTVQNSIIFSVPEEIFSGILNVFHELNRISDAIDWLKSLLSISERREDQARIQLELGKLYLHQGLIHDASEALNLSLDLFDGEDGSAFELLKRVELLGERGIHEDSRSNDLASEQRIGGDCLTAITEDGESDYITEGTSGVVSSNFVTRNKHNNELDEDDDNDSEDLSKIMTEIDQADDHALPQIGRKDVYSPRDTTEVLVHTDYTSNKLIEEEKEEELSQLYLPTDTTLDKLMNNPETETPNLSSNYATSNEDATSINVASNDDKDSTGVENFQQHITDQNEENRINDTQSSQSSANSRTGLLNSTEEPDITQKSLNLPKIPSSPKHATDEKSFRGRKGYTEIKTSGKQSGATGRKRIVKALSSPFKRSRSKSRSTNSNQLVALDEEREIRQSMPTKKSHRDPVEEESLHSREAPISYIDLQGTSDDDRSLVSQLTFREYEMLSKKIERRNENGHWWWGVTAEGLVNQAVEAAEGFLSAKSIHDRVKSRPLDYDSDEESSSEEIDEDFTLLKDSFSQQSKTSRDKNISPKNDSSDPVNSPQRIRDQPSESSPTKEVDESNSGSNKSQSLESTIREKETELECLRKENGPEDISVARLLFELAEFHHKKGDSTVAMLYSHQAMKIQKSTLNLPEACKSLNFIAKLHYQETRYKDALLCYSEVQRIHEAVYGYFHEEIAADLNNCGHILARQGKFDLAMDKHKEALRILKECCGENVKNPLVSETLIQIGAVYYKERNSLATIQSKQNDGYKTFIEGGMLEIIGRAHEDRGSYRMAIAFFEEKLQVLNDGKESDDSEDVAETLNSLGMLSCRAGMYLEAIDYYDRALGIQMKLGCDDVQLAMARVLAGSVQYSLGHYTKALKLFEDALGTLRQVGLEQETVAATLFHIGAVHAALCNYDDAMSNLRDAFDIQSKLLGTEHPATFRTRREIGNLYAVYESEVDAAFDEYNDILEAQRRLHGEKHPYVAETLHSIGCAQASKGDLSGALRTLEDCYNMRIKFLGMDHPQQATTLHEIAKIQLKRGRVKKAMHIVDAALNIRVESLSEQHIDVALAMATKASCLAARTNYVDANKLFMEALPIAKAAVGDMHPSVAWIQVQIGGMHLRKCDFDEASSSVKKAIAIYRQSNLDDDHPGIKEANQELERIERSEMLCV